MHACMPAGAISVRGFPLLHAFRVGFEHICSVHFSMFFGQGGRQRCEFNIQFTILVWVLVVLFLLLLLLLRLYNGSGF